MRKAVAFLNSVPTVKNALIGGLVMGVFMFGASVAGGIVSRVIADRNLPKQTMHCVCEP